jgi:hypothetical protein
MPGTRLIEDAAEIRYECTPVDLLAGTIISGAEIISCHHPVETRGYRQVSRP